MEKKKNELHHLPQEDLFYARAKNAGVFSSAEIQNLAARNSIIQIRVESCSQYSFLFFSFSFGHTFCPVKGTCLSCGTSTTSGDQFIKILTEVLNNCSWYCLFHTQMAWS